jgi:hypothetical protein
VEAAQLTRARRPGLDRLRAVLVSLALLTALPRAPAVLPVHAASNAIQLENSLPGDQTWNWFNPPVADDTLSGYGSKTSVNHGESIDFFVTTNEPSFSIDIYRTGWYGGAGARLITSLGSFPGMHQPIPAPDPVTGMIACAWAKATSLTIPSSWTTGVYLARLNAPSGYKTFIFFVVRNDGGYEDLVFQSSVTTAQAYNLWGGISLYGNQTSGAVYPYWHATKVSFDRPFQPLHSQGAGDYLKWEYPAVRWIESHGYDVTYTTDVDTDTNVNPLTNHKGFLSVGHDEYWSKAMRDHVRSAINAGVSVGFFGGDEIGYQIRFEANAAGQPDRVEVGYKNFATSLVAPGPDPMFNVNNQLVTAGWGDPPVNLPSNAVSGMVPGGAAGGDYVVRNASSWVYAGTGLVDGSVVPSIVGYEFDQVSNNGFSPPGLTILSQSPMGSTSANSTIYTAASGAIVFNAGTIDWSSTLDPSGYGCGRACLSPALQQATANILNAFVSGAPIVHDLKLSVPTTARTGQPFTASVVAEDARGIPVPTYRGKVHFSSSDTSSGVVLPPDSTLTNGQGSFSITLMNLGSQTLTVADAALSLSTTAIIAVQAQPASHLVLATTAAPIAGGAFSFTVTAEDPYGNIDPSYAGTVHFTTTDSSPGVLLPANSTVAKGQQTFSAILDRAGSQTVTATDTGTASVTGSLTVDVRAAPANRLAVATTAAPTAGVAFAFTVTAEDPFGNVDPSYAGSVHFATSDPSPGVVLPTNALLTNGQAAFSATLDRAGPETISAADTVTAGLSGSLTVAVKAAPATHLAVGSGATPTAGVAFSFTVTALDQFGNTDPSYSGTVYFTSTDSSPGVALPANATITGGSRTFTATLDKSGVQTITGTDTVTTTIKGSLSVRVRAASAKTMTLVAPTTAKTNQAFNVTVTLKDQFGNLADGYTGTVRFSSTDPLASLGLLGKMPASYTYTSGDAGTHTFSVTLATPTALGPGTTITVSDTANSSLSATSAPITVSAI